MAYSVLEDGTKVIAPIGSEVSAKQAVAASENGKRGRATELSIAPPEPDEFAASAAPGSPRAIDLAVQKGMIPADVAERWRDESGEVAPGEVGVQSSHYSGGSFLDDACLEADNNTGRIYGCGQRYRSNQDPNVFGVRHNATAYKKSTWTLTRARSGAYYDGTGRVKQWSPTREVNNDCKDYTFKGSYNSLSLSMTGPVCSSSVGPEVGSTYFKSRWKGTSWGGRDAPGVHWFHRPAGTQPGYKFHVHFFAV
jgi:hypothetical protein